MGLFSATVYGLVQFVFEPYIFHPAQVILDYPLAFGLMGLAGFFQEHPFVGATIGITGRFLAHFLSGIIFFANFAPEGMHPAIYSAFYNGGYILVELVLSLYILYVLRESKVLNIHL